MAELVIVLFVLIVGAHTTTLTLEEETVRVALRNTTYELNIAVEKNDLQFNHIEAAKEAFMGVCPVIDKLNNEKYKNDLFAEIKEIIKDTLGKGESGFQKHGYIIFPHNALRKAIEVINDLILVMFHIMNDGDIKRDILLNETGKKLLEIAHTIGGEWDKIEIAKARFIETNYLITKAFDLFEKSGDKLPQVTDNLGVKITKAFGDVLTKTGNKFFYNKYGQVMKIAISALYDYIVKGEIYKFISELLHASEFILNDYENAENKKVLQHEFNMKAAEVFLKISHEIWSPLTAYENCPNISKALFHLMVHAMDLFKNKELQKDALSFKILLGKYSTQLRVMRTHLRSIEADTKDEDTKHEGTIEEGTEEEDTIKRRTTEEIDADALITCGQMLNQNMKSFLVLYYMLRFVERFSENVTFILITASELKKQIIWHIMTCFNFQDAMGITHAEDDSQNLRYFLQWKSVMEALARYVKDGDSIILISSLVNVVTVLQ